MSGAPPDVVLERLLDAIGTAPIDGAGAVLALDAGELRPSTPWPLAAPPSGEVAGGPGTGGPGNVGPGPWWDVARTGIALDVADLGELAPDVAAEIEASGHRAVWCRPLHDRTTVIGVLVVLVPHDRAPDAAERLRLADAADLASVALGGIGVRDADLVDDLTGAATTAQLAIEIELGIDAAAIAYLDLDGLDDVNVEFGSGGGDVVLAEVARRLDVVTRPSDLVVRCAGDEFLIVVRDVAELESIRIAARVVDELALPYEIATPDGGSVLVSVTAGVGLCVQAPGTPFDVALQAAVRALEEAKLAGQHRLHVVSR
jgi:diguanylate cyclase (GGDEF)-like protein